jgi:hypothetical protein
MCAVDLLVLTSSDQMFFLLKLCFSFFYKTTYLSEEANCTEPSSSVSVLWRNLQVQQNKLVHFENTAW